MNGIDPTLSGISRRTRDDLPRTPYAPRMRSLHDRIVIAHPCTENWEAMAPSASGQSRRCESCEREVHHISAMTHAEVESLLAHSNAPLCGRYRVREDGAIVVADGYMLPAVDSKRRLPVLAAIAFGLAACTTSATPSPPEPTPDVAVHPSAGEPPATATADTSGASLVRDAGEDDAALDAGTTVDAATRDAATCNAPTRKPGKPAFKGPTMMGGLGRYTQR